MLQHRLFRLTLAALIMFGGVGLTLTGTSQAQDGASCPALLDDVITAAQDACADLAAGEACYASAAAVLGDAFAEPGDVAALADLAAGQTLTTTAADPGAETWGVAMLRAALDLPEDSGSAASMILFGAAELTNLVDPNAEAAPTITLANSAGYPVNLRGGAGTNYPTVGTLDDGVEAVADGRSEAGDWFRIRTEDGLGWVFGDLVNVVDGDPASLDVLPPDSLILGYTAPLQAVELTTHGAESACGLASAGLLLQLSGEESAHFQINGVDLVIADATLLFHAPTAEAMDIIVLAGSVSVSANGIGVSADAGARVAVEYANESGPIVHQAYAFAAIDGAPLGLLADDVTLACVTGTQPDADEIMLTTGPGDPYVDLAPMDADLHYTVTGQAADEDGAPYYRLSVAGYAQAWVPQDAVSTLGTCGAVEEVAAPPVGGPTGGGSGLVPAGQSVWQSDPGLDNMAGQCGGPPIALCAHLVAITPNADGTISWRGQELTPYTLSPIGDNTYYYNGRNVLGTGSVEMTLTFTSESEWQMTLTTTLDSEPGCTHTFYYTATRNW